MGRLPLCFAACEAMEQGYEREEYLGIYWLFDVMYGSRGGVGEQVRSFTECVEVAEWPRFVGRCGGERAGEFEYGFDELCDLDHPNCRRGRNGHGPSMSVNYSSSSGTSEMGIGWNLSAGGTIERLTVRGLPRYGRNLGEYKTEGNIREVLESEDKFYGGSGELVHIPGTPFYRAKYEGGFVRYRWHRKDRKDQVGYWSAEYPGGNIGFFGASYQVNGDREVVSTRGDLDLESHVRGGYGTFRWHLRSLVDRNGNRIEYKYKREGSQVYLDTVYWVFNDEGNALYHVKFEREKTTRSDHRWKGRISSRDTPTDQEDQHLFGRLIDTGVWI